MKKFWILIGLVVNFCFSSAGQKVSSISEDAKFKLFYSLEFKQDTLDLDYSRKEKMVLLVGETISKFLSYGNYFMDSTSMANPEMNFDLYLSLNPPRIIHHFQVFKLFDSGNMLTVDRVFADSFQYSEMINNIQWEITNSTEIILGYKAQKAIGKFGGRTWNAWFTTEIPLSNGPYKFHGLPGLIIKVFDSQNHYVFELESFQEVRPNNEKIFLRRGNYIQTSKRDFFDVREKFRQDAIAGILTSGMPVHESTDLNRIQDNQRRRNNPIELTAD
ncbi:MAG: GLPGLI family protein [Bacteroidales bacterium]|nr:GLPGLI family protein [Bacteroidales bacterium]